MSDFPGWTLDPTRNEYYYYSQREGAYIYQNGARIYVHGAAGANAPGGGGNRNPNVPRTHTTQGDVEAAVDPEKDSDDDDDDDDDSNDELVENMERIDLGGQVYVRGVEAQDPELPAGVKVKGRLKGSFGKKEYEKLYPNFKIRRPGQKFFVRGKVFKALWAEMAGNSNESVTTTPDSKFGENIATKIRWFVVVREGHNFCTCLPIVTYNRQGVAKNGIVKENHAIAYSTRDPPKARSGELPKGAENPMMPEIRVKAKRKGDKLDRMSRIDFSRMYTVEHNVKVYDFGDVHKDYLDKLIQHWIRVISRDLVGGLFNMPVKPQMRRGDDEDRYRDSDDDGNNDANEDDDDDEDDESSSSDGNEEKPTYGPGAAPGYGTTYPTTGYTTAGAATNTAAGYANPASGYTGSTTGYSGSSTGYGVSSTGYTASSGGYQGTSGTYPTSGGYSRRGERESTRDSSDRKSRSSKDKKGRRRD